MSWTSSFVKNCQNLLSSNPEPDLHHINAHSKFVGIHWYLLKLSTRNEYSDGGTTDGRPDRHTNKRIDRRADTNVKPWYPATSVWRGMKSNAVKKISSNFSRDYLMIFTSISALKWFTEVIIRQASKDEVELQLVSLYCHGTVSSFKVMSRPSIYLHTYLYKRLPSNYCPAWFIGRERIMNENNSWLIYRKECCRTRKGWGDDF